MSTMALAPRPGLLRARDHERQLASDMDVDADAGAALRYRDRWGAATSRPVNVSAEFAYSLDRAASPTGRSVPSRASPMPSCLRRHHRRAAELSELEAVKKAIPDMAVLANTGVKHAT